MPARGVEERAAFADAMALIGALAGAAIGLAVLFGSRDPAMAFHGLLFVLAGGLAALASAAWKANAVSSALATANRHRNADIEKTSTRPASPCVIDFAV